MSAPRPLIPSVSYASINSKTRFSTDHEFEEDVELTPLTEIVSHADEPLLKTDEKASNKPTQSVAVSVPYDPHQTKPSPTKSTMTYQSYDEEELKPEPEPEPDTPENRKKLTARKKTQRILDISQRATSFLLSIAILVTMAVALAHFEVRKDRVIDGVPIYPTFMQLWPTYMVIAAGGLTVILNGLVLGWRIHGSAKDFHREEMYNKYWDYVMHAINGAVWLATSTTFGVSKSFGPAAADPDTLFGYVCSETAADITRSFPKQVEFDFMCSIQTASFWTSVSSVFVEAFAIAAKLFVK